MAKEFILSISLLVSNRRDTIRKCMDSIKPILDSVSSELIAVDTVGEENSDGSLAIVKEYTDQIVRFEWCNDFAAARNAGLKKARGKWFLTLDDDEWFEDATEIINFFTTGEYEKYNSGYYYVKNYTAKGDHSMSVVGRMIRLLPTTCYEGKVHESFNEVKGPHKQFSCYVHHYGYAFADVDAAKKHQDRNLSILKEELVSEGGTPRLCAQMVQELIHIDDTTDAGYRFAMDALQRNMDNPEWFLDPCAQWTIAASVRYFNRKKDYEGAKKQYEWVVANFKISEMGRLVIYGTMANMAAEAQDIEALSFYANKYLEMYDWQRDNQEAAIVKTTLDMPKYKGELYYYRIVYFAAAAANRKGDFVKAEELWCRMPWGNASFDGKEYEEEYQRTKERLSSAARPEFIKSDIKLTIGMLVSNHIKYIRKAMEALQPLLQAVPSELVAIDTMGKDTDGSIDIVREYTDKIYPFAWCNDFSAARNFCLSHAKGEWFLYTDDDEWFDNVQEFIDFFRNGESEQYAFASYYTRDYLPDGSYSMGLAGRMIRRTENTCFVGKVHETFNEVYSPIKEFSCFTHHYGYAYETEEQRLAKQKRNIDMLKEEIKEKGLSAQRAAQMTQELLGNNETIEDGFEFCMSGIQDLVNRGEEENSCVQWMMVASVRKFAVQNKQEEVIGQAEFISSKYKLSNIARMAVAAVAIDAAVSLQRYEKALEYGNEYMEAWDWKQENPQEALLQSNLDLPRFYSEDYYYKTVFSSAIAANRLGRFETANQYWKRMPWKKEGFPGYRYAEEMNKTVQGLKELREKEMMTESLLKQMELLDTMKEAEGYVDKLLKTENGQELSELLAGIQEFAISVGNSLDNLLGEGTEEVAILEEYCELVWRCNNEEFREEKENVLHEMKQLSSEIMQKIRGYIE